ncbi:hypothetical protein EYF80_036641 [Liparis tanakae]|uniref:Uncharacterized protein n=1 Tax=Liparis tanakae TaxID=230148 RepID=A0A4Z2GK60_9TELE|nr:hypothetical protein EYF80_036641 [Liparis tanakae]
MHFKLSLTPTSHPRAQPLDPRIMKGNRRIMSGTSPGTC